MSNIELAREQLRSTSDILNKINNKVSLGEKPEINLYTKTAKVYTSGRAIDEKQEEKHIHVQQAAVVAEILKHKNCPENLTVTITRTQEAGTYTSNGRRERMILP